MIENPNKDEVVSENVESKDDLIKALGSDFSTSVNRIYINSIDKFVDFREIKVNEQKSLSRIMIENERKKDVIFDAQCSLINSVALDKDFNVYKLTEFDRLKLMIAIYQANMFKNKVEFTCPKCGAKNTYTLDFDNVIKRLDSVKVCDQTFNYENKNWKYEFTVAYPSVKYIAKFHRQNAKRYIGIHKSNMQYADAETNMDYVDLYIKEIKLENKTNGAKKDIKLYNYTPAEVEEILSVFPQDVLYSDNGILKFITNEFIKKINDSFDAQICYQCGEKYENTIGNASSFF